MNRSVTTRGIIPFHLIIFSFLSIHMYAQTTQCGVCNDGPFSSVIGTFTTACGQCFDLCADFSDLTNGMAEIKIVANDNFDGLVDPCSFELFENFLFDGEEYPRFGTLAWKNGTPCSGTVIYTMNDEVLNNPELWPGLDTFFYAAMYFDNCADICYCEPGIEDCADGRIWSADILYQGTQIASRIEVYPQQGQSQHNVAIGVFEDVAPGSIIFVDGTQDVNGDPVSANNWYFEFTIDNSIFTLPSPNSNKDGLLHVSCSEAIFGENYNIVDDQNMSGQGFIRPISGCIAGNNSGGTCGSDPTSPTATTKYTDTTFVVVQADFVLPIHLIEFQASDWQSTIRLNWKVDLVSQGEMFVVQKSDDAERFTDLAEIYFADQKFQYQFIDENPLNGLNYYRLKMIDTDGEVNYSPVKVVHVNSHREAYVFYPNPTSGQVFIRMPNTTEESTEIRIFDIHGKLITKQSFDNRTNQLQLSNIGSFNAGTYLIQVFRNAKLVAQNRMAKI